MSELVRFQQQFRVQGPDGRLLYIGVGKVLNPFDFINNEASATMDVCEAVKMDTTNSIVGTMLSYAAGDSVSGSLPQTEELYGKRVAAATDTGFIGVCTTRLPSRNAVQPIYYPAITPPPGAEVVGVAAGVGSIVPVKSTPAATLSSNNALTYHVIGSTTAGAVGAAASTTLGYSLGYIVKTAGGAGSGATMNIADGYLGVLVMPH